MEILDVRALVAEALQKIEAFDRVSALGNVVYVHVGKKEYEVVIRTIRPEAWEGMKHHPNDPQP